MALLAAPAASVEWTCMGVRRGSLGFALGALALVAVLAIAVLAVAGSALGAMTRDTSASGHAHHGSHASHAKAHASRGKGARRTRRARRSPTIRWRSPKYGRTVTGRLNQRARNCIVKARPRGRVDHVTFYLDGARLNTDHFRPYSCVWDTSTAAEGSSHTLKAVAYAKRGRRAWRSGHRASRSVDVRVDNAPSVVSGEGAIPHTGAVVKQDLTDDANFRSLWDHINEGPDNRVEYHATGGDPHPLVNGSVNPSWRRINHLNGDEREGRIRQQMGANSTSDAETFKAYQRGERWITYWSMRIHSVDIPSDTGSQVWQMYPEGPKGSGSPPISFGWRRGNVLRLKADQGGGGDAEPWSATVPVDTWLRFAVDVRYDVAGKSFVQLWGSLSETGPLKPLSQPRTDLNVLPSGHSASALIAGIYGEDTIPPHHIDFANWQVARWVP